MIEPMSNSIRWVGRSYEGERYYEGFVRGNSPDTNWDLTWRIESCPLDGEFLVLKYSLGPEDHAVETFPRLWHAKAWVEKQYGEIDGPLNWIRHREEDGSVEYYGSREVNPRIRRFNPSWKIILEGDQWVVSYWVEGAWCEEARFNRFKQAKSFCEQQAG